MARRKLKNCIVCGEEFLPHVNGQKRCGSRRKKTGCAYIYDLSVHHGKYWEGRENELSSLREARGKVLRKKREGYLRKKYGIGIWEYEILSEIQKGLCAICGLKPKSTWSENLYVDHNHETNTVRGLLCNSCNKGLGMLGDSVVILESAIEYLNNSKQ